MSITALEIIVPYLLEFCVCDSEIEPHTKSGDTCSAKKILNFVLCYLGLHVSGRTKRSYSK